MISSKYSVILVDDEPIVRKMLEERINKVENVTVVASFSNGFSAKSYLMEHIVDMVITDIKMPLMDGLELTEFIKNHYPACKVIIVSGYDDFEYARRAIKYGVKEYLLKPLKFKIVVELIEKCCSDINSERQSFWLSNINDERMQQNVSREIQLGKLPVELQEVDKQMESMAGIVVKIANRREDVLEDKGLAVLYYNILKSVLLNCAVYLMGAEQKDYTFLVLNLNQQNYSMRAVSEYIERVLTICVKVEFLTVRNMVEVKELLFTNQFDQNRRIINIACKYMEEHVHEALSRDAIAEYVNVSPYHFSRLFKQIEGVSYSEYLMNLRISKAKKMLAESISIKDIAIYVGFEDPKYFSEVFNKKTGFTPSEFRKKVINGEVQYDMGE